MSIHRHLQLEGRQKIRLNQREREWETAYLLLGIAFGPTIERLKPAGLLGFDWRRADHILLLLGRLSSRIDALQQQRTSFGCGETAAHGDVQCLEGIKGRGGLAGQFKGLKLLRQQVVANNVGQVAFARALPQLRPV